MCQLDHVGQHATTLCQNPQQLGKSKQIVRNVEPVSRHSAVKGDNELLHAEGSPFG